MIPTDLPSHWRERAAELTRYAPAAASAFEDAAVELERSLAAHEDAELSLAEASRESGYSRRRLRELIADGSIPQAGRKGAPRIRRADLPRKPTSVTNGSGGYDACEDADTLIEKIG